MGCKILIADDEVKSIQLIQELGHWEELGIEITAICNDGAQAFCRIQEVRPDIVLADRFHAQEKFLED